MSKGNSLLLIPPFRGDNKPQFPSCYPRYGQRLFCCMYLTCLLVARRRFQAHARNEVERLHPTLTNLIVDALEQHKRTLTEVIKNQVSPELRERLERRCTPAQDKNRVFGGKCSLLLKQTYCSGYQALFRTPVRHVGLKGDILA